jgi:hypothetical protein
MSMVWNFNKVFSTFISTFLCPSRPVILSRNAQNLSRSTLILRANRLQMKQLERGDEFRHYPSTWSQG